MQFFSPRREPAKYGGLDAMPLSDWLAEKAKGLWDPKGCIEVRGRRPVSSVGRVARRRTGLVSPPSVLAL